MSSARIVYYPQMARLSERFRQSRIYRGEALTLLARYREMEPTDGAVVVLGRHGNHHDLDLLHTKMLRGKGVIPPPEETTLVVFDWHEDVDNDPAGTELTAGSWVYVGLQQGLYANCYLVGTNPRGINELNAYQAGEEVLPNVSALAGVLDRLFLFPAASGISILRLSSDLQERVARNESVSECYPCPGGGCAAVRFRGMDEVRYAVRRSGVVVSIDLDVLRRSAVRTVCPQGVLSVSDLVAHLQKLRATGPIAAVLICGLTEEEGAQEDVSVETVCSLLAASSALLQ